MIVPAKPVIAAKTSLFQDPNNARCAISIADKLKTNAIANFVPNTNRSLGDTSSVAASALFCRAVLLVIRRVKARRTQSVNGYAPSAGVGNAQNSRFHF